MSDAGSTGRMVPFDSRWIERSLRAPFTSSLRSESNGGGGGSRTRVREYADAELYMHSRF